MSLSSALFSTFCAIALFVSQRPVTAAERRASEVSPNGTTEAQKLLKPGAVSPGDRAADYVLGPEDQIIVHAFQAPEIPNTAVQVGGDGYVNLPLVGRVKASGLTVSSLEQELAARLGNYIRDPQVTVLVAEYRSQPVSVLGAVSNPGVVQLKGRKNLLEVIALAGGLKSEAGSTVTITRELANGRIPLPDASDDPTGKFSIGHVEIHDVMQAQNPQNNIVIQRDDIIMVARARVLYVVGEVNKPGGYPFNERDSMSLLQAVALAGGLTQRAAATRAKILHQDTSSTARTEVPANVRKILDGRAPDVTLHPDDILFIPNSKAKAAGSAAMQTAINMASIAVWRF
ncbi:MAG: polysaccharide biosynthesis/export family protein [Acidobacteriaceae bacterium]|nr:polysaccharide biosynthesis/export family protein [Acidobacteriaceae bacterium]